MHRLTRHAAHLCLLRPVAVGLVVALTLLHPLLHTFEGGTLDLVLAYLDQWALTLAASPTD